MNTKAKKKVEAVEEVAALKGITVEMELRLQKYEESLATAAEATG